MPDRYAPGARKPHPYVKRQRQRPGWAVSREDAVDLWDLEVYLLGPQVNGSRLHQLRQLMELHGLMPPWLQKRAKRRAPLTLEQAAEVIRVWRAAEGRELLAKSARLPPGTPPTARRER